MKYKLVKKGNNVNFINCENENSFDYVEFADKLYVGDKIEISDYGNITGEEKKIVDKTIKELNDLSNIRKRKRIIAQIDNE